MLLRQRARKCRAALSGVSLGTTLPENRWPEIRRSQVRSESREPAATKAMYVASNRCVSGALWFTRGTCPGLDRAPVARLRQLHLLLEGCQRRLHERRKLCEPVALHACQRADVEPIAVPAPDPSRKDEPGLTKHTQVPGRPTMTLRDFENGY